VVALKTGENKDVLDGIGSAGGSLARGLTDGVSGLIKNPLKGAESGGFAGFAKGVGTGMLGLVVKPVVGVTDAATDLLQGEYEKTDVFSPQHACFQVRPRRVLYGPMRTLRPYAIEDARAAALLRVSFVSRPPRSSRASTASPFF
ncbi:unnamed protein product, partial [Ectocarpus sp. 13 AM-2016]